MWWWIGRDHPFLFSLFFWIFSSRVSGHQRGGLSVWDLFWVLEGCSSFHVSSGDLASSVFFRLLCVDFLLFPPGSTQVFAIKLLQNVFPGGFCYVFDFLCDSFGCFCQFLVIEVSFRLISGYLGILSPYCLSFVAEKSLFFLFMCLRLY